MRAAWALALVLAAGCGGSSDDSVASESVARATKLAEVVSAFGKDGLAEVWPGFSLTSAPLVVTFDDGKAIAFGLNDATGWTGTDFSGLPALEAATDRWGLAQAPFMPAYPVGSERVFVFRLADGEGVERSIQQLIERRFLLSLAPRAMGTYPDAGKGENLALARVEALALAKWLETGEKERLAEFVAVRSARLSGLSEESRRWESAAIGREGMAKYVSLKFLDLRPVLGKRNGKEELVDALRRSSELSASELLTHRPGLIGAAIGYALDSTEAKDWKPRVAKGDDPMAILKESISTGESSTPPDLEKLKTAFGYEELAKTAATNAPVLAADSSTRLQLDSGALGEIFGYLQPGARGITQGGQIEETGLEGSMCDRTGQFLVVATGVGRDPDGFRLGSDAKLNLDGQDVVLTDAVAGSFKQVSLDSSTLRVRFAGAGRVERKDGTIRLVFEKADALLPNFGLVQLGKPK